MSRRSPPPTFPTPNVTRAGSTYSLPPGPVRVYPPQTSNHGTYATSQPPQPPPAHRTRDPYSANSYVPASTYSYSSSPPHPSAHLPSSGPPQAPSSIPTPSAPGGYGASTNFFGAPPPPMMQRIATMPTPGQGHNPHSVPYHNVPAPVIAHHPSHSHSGMSGGTRSVTGDWSHHDQSYSQNEDLGQRPEGTSHMSGDYLRERAPPSIPVGGQLPKCKYCEKETPRATYDTFKGFCKQKHKDKWYEKHNQNQNQHDNNGA